MGILKAFRNIFWFLVVSALAGFSPVCAGAESAPLHLAVGPFFAPPGNSALQALADTFPDLLTVKLSQSNDFQLVERTRVATLWNELQLTANGLTSREAMLKLGNVLACDRFVSGSFFVTATNIQVWITVIDTHNGTVTDFAVLPVSPSNLQPAMDAIADFLAKTKTRQQPQRFIALGRFVDLSISTSHEDWSGRVREMIEKHFHENGYGVVEHEAVTPVFEEFQLEQAGFSESQTNRVKFQPSFWIIDGGCKWVRDTEDKLSVAIRIRKVGEGEQTLSFRAWPDATLETNIIASISSAMGDTNRIPDAQLVQSQLAAHLAELERFLMKTAPMTADRFSTDTNAILSAYRKDQENKAAAINEAQSVLLLDPDNLRAKWVLGELYFLKLNEPDLRVRGIQILEELAAGPNKGYAALAESKLTDTDTTIMGPDGKDIKVPPARPKKTLPSKAVSIRVS